MNRYYISWILHFILFIIFGTLFFDETVMGVIGIIAAALLIEIDQALSWQRKEVWRWFIKLDTWMDLGAGIVGGLIGLKLLRVLIWDLWQ